MQPQVLRMESDLVEVLIAAIEERVLEQQIKWSQNPSGCVILASGGYPLKYAKGKRIEGLKEAAEAKGITIFHAGTELKDDEFYTAGGRVLGVCASEKTLAETMKNDLDNPITRIEFDGRRVHTKDFQCECRGFH